MAQIYNFKVEFDYTEGMFRGKNIVPKHDRFQHTVADIETYHENQLKVIISKTLQKNGVKVPYIVNIRVIETTEIY